MCRSAATSALFVPVLLAMSMVVQPLPAALQKVEINGKDGASKADTGLKPSNQTAAPGDVEVHFLNGSTVRMVVQAEVLEVATPYGKLSVPAKHLRAIEFGVHFPPGAEAKIEEAVKNLGSSNNKEREKASNTLIDLGPFSYPAVYEASRGKDPEVSTRAMEIVKKLKANHASKDLKTSSEDKVTTPTFTIVGRILNPTIRVKAEYFGEKELSLSNMRTLRTLGELRKDIEVTVDAARYANAGQWLETKCHVDGKTEFTIVAKGLVDTGPAQKMAAIAVAGPNGMQRVALKKMAGVLAPGQKIGAIGAEHAGMLLGKIGENGEPFFIGEHYQASTEVEGTLFLHIGPSSYGCPSSGSYDVKISPKN